MAHLLLMDTGAAIVNECVRRNMTKGNDNECSFKRKPEVVHVTEFIYSRIHRFLKEFFRQTFLHIVFMTAYLTVLMLSQINMVKERKVFMSDFVHCNSHTRNHDNTYL
uniref:Uncharacterized protein n=1 Tax=Echinococcus canadensis TaxID=519352 RepID=A0A915EWP5_9CEST